MVNVLNFTFTSPPSAADLQELAENVVQEWTVTLAPLQSSLWQMDEVTVYDSSAPAGAPGTVLSIGALPLQGSGGSDVVPNQVAGIIKYITQGGPPFRGRSYIGGLIPDTIGASGTFGPNTRLQMTNFGEAIKSITLSSGNVGSLVIVSSGTPAAPAGTFAIVDVISTNPAPRTQRRRAVGIGS